MIELKNILDRLDIDATSFYELAGTTQQKLSYAKKHNIEAYENFLLSGICRHYKLDSIKLIDLIDSLKKIKETI